jgi:hypothetical protein
MANDSTGGVPVMDFSTIGELGKTYRDAAMQTNRQRTLAELTQSAGPLDYERAARSLIAGGDLQGDLSLARLGQRHYPSIGDFGIVRAPSANPVNVNASNAGASMPGTSRPPPPDFTVPGQASARLPYDYTPQRAIAEARAAIAGGRDRRAVIQRILSLGIDPRGL